MLHAILPSFLTYNTADDLTRLGRDHDGGYLISSADMAASDTLIGLGINDDWSFERDFSHRKNIPIYAFDASVNQTYFFQQILKAIPRFDKPQKLFYWLKVWRDYRHFFSVPQHYHIEQFVGFDADDDRHCTFDDVLAKTASDNIFLKIDVEGSEYRFLDALIAHQDRFTGAVIEFHDCDLHLAEIERFVDGFGLEIAHIHANNFSPIRAGDRLPEISFTRQAAFDKAALGKGALGEEAMGKGAVLPHPLDQPNDHAAAEIHLEIAES